MSVDLEAELDLQAAAWDRNALLRSLYRSWFAELARSRSNVPGLTVELGSGIGKLREALPDVLLTDVEETRWAGSAVDAQALPFADGTLANIVLVDVLHHIPRPARFLDEARRTLAVGGRVLLVEPYCSTVSYAVYRRWHHELTDLDVDPLAESPRSSTDPLDSNQALPTLLFFTRADFFERRWPELQIVKRRRFAFFAYPLSGGWRRRPLLPAKLARPVLAVERALSPLAAVVAFRCLVVLERRGDVQWQ
jgi:SAM-dependent methyltransferase